MFFFFCTQYHRVYLGSLGGSGELGGGGMERGFFSFGFFFSFSFFSFGFFLRFFLFLFPFFRYPNLYVHA